MAGLVGDDALGSADNWSLVAYVAGVGTLERAGVETLERAGDGDGTLERSGNKTLERGGGETLERAGDNTPGTEDALEISPDNAEDSVVVVAADTSKEVEMDHRRHLNEQGEEEDQSSACFYRVHQLCGGQLVWRGGEERRGDGERRI